MLDHGADSNSNEKYAAPLQPLGKEIAQKGYVHVKNVHLKVTRESRLDTQYLFVRLDFQNLLRVCLHSGVHQREAHLSAKISERVGGSLARVGSTVSFAAARTISPFGLTHVSTMPFLAGTAGQSRSPNRTCWAQRTEDENKYGRMRHEQPVRMYSPLKSA